MLCSDVIKHLIAYLPRYTTLFNSTLDVSSVLFSGDDIDITFASNHNLTTGQQISVHNVLVNTEIDPLDYTDNPTVKAETLSDHDLTQGFQSKVKITNSTNPAVNGEFDLLTVPNRREFTFSFTGVAPTPPFGTVYLSEDITGNPFNGIHTVTVLTPTSIRITVPNNPYTQVSAENIIVSTGVNISGATDFDRLEVAYESQDTLEAWLFVVLDDVTSGKNRGTPLDAISNQANLSAWNIEQIAEFTTFVFIPSSDEVTGRDARDKAEELRSALYRTLVNAQFNNGLAASAPYSTVIPVSDGIAARSNAYYVHQYRWQQVSQVSIGDIGYFGNNRAFRDIELLQLNDFENTIMQSDIDLDDEPL